MILPENIQNYLDLNFSEASNYKDISKNVHKKVIYFEVGPNRYILKSGNNNSIESEIYFLEKLKNQNIVPKLTNYDIEKGILVMEFIDGHVFDLNDYAIADGSYFVMGKLTKLINSIPTTGSGRYSSRSFDQTSNVRYVKYLMQNLIEEDEFLKVLDINDKLMNSLQNLVWKYPLLPNILVHGDLHISNFIFVNNIPKYVIDPSAFRGGDAFFDIGMCYYHILNRQTHEKDWEEFKNGYGKEFIEENMQWVLLHSILSNLYLNLFEFQRFGSKAQYFTTTLLQDQMSQLIG